MLLFAHHHKCAERHYVSALSKESSPLFFPHYDLASRRSRLDDLPLLFEYSCCNIICFASSFLFVCVADEGIVEPNITRLS